MGRTFFYYLLVAILIMAYVLFNVEVGADTDPDAYRFLLIVLIICVIIFIPLFAIKLVKSVIEFFRSL